MLAEVSRGRTGPRASPHPRSFTRLWTRAPFALRRARGKEQRWQV